MPQTYQTFKYLPKLGEVAATYNGSCTIKFSELDGDLSLLIPHLSRPFYTTATTQYLLWATSILSVLSSYKEAKKQQSDQPVTFATRCHVIVHTFSKEPPDTAETRRVRGGISAHNSVKLLFYRKNVLLVEADIDASGIMPRKAKYLSHMRETICKQHPIISDEAFQFYDPADPKIFFSNFELGERIQCLMSLDRSLKQHPFFTGSGDHVSTQMFTDQFERILPIWLEKKFGPLYLSKTWFVKKNTMDLIRIVEMGRIFEIEIESCDVWNLTGFHIKSKYYQFGNLCVEMEMYFLPDVLDISLKANL